MKNIKETLLKALEYIIYATTIYSAGYIYYARFIVDVDLSNAKFLVSNVDLYIRLIISLFFSLWFYKNSETRKTKES